MRPTTSSVRLMSSPGQPSLATPRISVPLFSCFHAAFNFAMLVSSFIYPSVNLKNPSQWSLGYNLTHSKAGPRRFAKRSTSFDFIVGQSANHRHDDVKPELASLAGKSSMASKATGPYCE